MSTIDKTADDKDDRARLHKAAWEIVKFETVVQEVSKAAALALQDLAMEYQAALTAAMQKMEQGK